MKRYVHIYTGAAYWPYLPARFVLITLYFAHFNWSLPHVQINEIRILFTREQCTVCEKPYSCGVKQGVVVLD